MKFTAFVALSLGSVVSQVTGMCDGNTDGTIVDCSAETTNTVNKGSGATGTTVEECCEAPPVTVTGMCDGNTDDATNVDCSGETTNTVNKGSGATGTTVEECCRAPTVHADPGLYQGTFAELPSFTEDNPFVEGGVATMVITADTMTTSVHVTATTNPDTDTVYPAHLHALPCAQDGGGHYQDPDNEGVVDNVSENWPTVTCTSTGCPKVEAASSWRPAKSPVAAGLSIVIHDTVEFGKSKMLCADLTRVESGLCEGNTNSADDVDCSGEATNTVNKGAFHLGTTVDECCQAPSECTAEDTPAGCIVPACTDVATPYAGCIVPTCTAEDTPYAGCTVPECTAEDTPYAGCAVPTCTAEDTPYAGCTNPDCTAEDTPAGCTVPTCTAEDTPYAGCTVPTCTAEDMPYAGCTVPTCTAVDTPYDGCTVPTCTAEDTPYAGCTPAEDKADTTKKAVSSAPVTRAFATLAVVFGVLLG